MSATTVKITGNTYPVKDAIKALGGRWNADEKCWQVMSNGLEAKMIATKVDGKHYGEKVMADRWFIVHTASGRNMLPLNFASQAEAESTIAKIYTAIPEADWTKPVADLVKIPNLQIRLLNA